MGGTMHFGRTAQARVREKIWRAMSCGRAVAAAGLTAGVLLTGLSVPAEAASVHKAPLRTAVRSLLVSAELNAGF